MEYTLIRNDADLRKFLVVNTILAGVISILGIIQAILGNSFLNPAVLAPRRLRKLDQVQSIDQPCTVSSGLGICEFGPFRPVPCLDV